MHGLCVADICRVLAGERELRQTQRVGAVGRGFAGRNQLVGRRHRVGDVGNHLHQQIVRERGLFRPILDVRPHAQLVLRLGLTITVVNALLIHAAIEEILRMGVGHIQIRCGGQAAAVDRRRGDGTCIHERHAGHLPLAGLAALAVREVSGRVADGELAVGRGVAGTEARAAEALADDRACGSDVGQRAVLHQLDICRHAARIDAHLELAVAAAVAAQNIRNCADVVKRAAGAARDQTLIDPDFAAANLAHQVELRAGDLRVGLLLALVQDIRRIGFQLGDGVGVAGVHRQGDGAFHGGEIDIYASIVIRHIGRLERPERFRTAVDGQIILRVLVGFPDGGPAGRFGRHDVDAVAVFNRQVRYAGADELHDLVLHIALSVDRADDGERHILRADAVARLAGQVDGDHARTRYVVGAAHQLFGQLAAALADGQRAQRAVTGVAVRTEDHAAAAGHHFAVVAMDDGHVRRHIDAAVLVRGGEGKHVIVLVDGAADGAQAVVAVGQHIRHREFLHAGGARCLNDADIGNVVAGQAVKAHAQILHVAALVVCLENAIGNRALFGFFLCDGSAAFAWERRRVSHDFTAVDEVYAAVVELYHGKIPFHV